VILGSSGGTGLLLTEIITQYLSPWEGRCLPMSFREKFFLNGFDKVENVQEKGRIDERRREQVKSSMPIRGGEYR
jgi:hypothetical protein